jgi:hypothetical protein
LCEVNNVRKIFFDCEKTSQSQKGVRNMGILRYALKGLSNQCDGFVNVYSGS